MNILVLGATAAISQATCLELAKKISTARFFLVGRNPQKLDALRTELNSLQPNCVAGTEAFDFRKLEEIPALIERAHAALVTVDAALVGHGTLLERDECLKNPQAFRQLVDENFISEALCVEESGKIMQDRGVVAVVTSVAGEAARPSSAAYSATKAALSRYLQGIRGVLWRRKIKIIDVRPGWVNTPMTQNSRTKFWAVEPEVAGRDIARAMLRRGPEVLYTPRRWAWVMGVIRLLPGWAWRGMK